MNEFFMTWSSIPISVHLFACFSQAKYKRNFIIKKKKKTGMKVEDFAMSTVYFLLFSNKINILISDISLLDLCSVILMEKKKLKTLSQGVWTSTNLELKIPVLVLISTSDIVYILSLTMLPMLYSKIDHPSPFVKKLTQQNSNLNCNLQWEIYYLTIFFSLPWNWRACLIGDTDHRWKDFQYSSKHARNQIHHPTLFSSKGLSIQNIK